MKRYAPDSAILTDAETFSADSHPRRRQTLVAFSAALLAIVTCACSSGRASGSTTVNAAAPVKVARVVSTAMPVEIDAVGTVQPKSTVTVKSRVDGELTAVHFREGQEVREGDLLFEIDPRPLQASLEQTKADLARDVAQAAQAAQELRRVEDLMKEGVLSQDQYDQARAISDALEAAVKAERSAVENARLQLQYASIRSPIEGRTGALLVHLGNLIHANDTSLVVINQIRPIDVQFSAAEKDLPAIRRYMASGPIRVQASVPGNEKIEVEGTLTFVDNSVDPATGTVRLKATFDNRNEILWPGQFVNVNVRLTTQADAIVVPSDAIQSGQQGDYVFVVKPDNTVEARKVVVDRTVGGVAVVASGLEPAETVVTDGQLRLVSGTKVEIEGEPTRADTRVGS